MTLAARSKAVALDVALVFVGFQHMLAVPRACL